MNIEATIPNAKTKITTTVAESTTSSATATTTSKDYVKSFKDELNSKAQESNLAGETITIEGAISVDTKKAEANQLNIGDKPSKADKNNDVSSLNIIDKTDKTVDINDATVPLNELTSQIIALGTVKNGFDPGTKKNKANNISQPVKAKQLNVTDKANKINKSADKNDAAVPINELSSQIMALNTFKNGSNPEAQNINSKIDEISGKSDYCQTIKMENKDITFFINLVDNQQMTAQAAQGINNSSSAISFTEIKAEATQKPVAVSVQLMDALNESFKTNKPFRIDFDSDIAVIMKVDKDGNLSANFIPGTAAVESYLKNNIATLRQTFDEQNLPYKNLSYNQQKQQQEKQKNKEKENE